MNFEQFDKEAWGKLTVGFSVLALGCAGVLAWVLSGGELLAGILGGALGALVVGPLVLILGSINLKLNDMRQKLQGQIEKEFSTTRKTLLEMVNIRPLVDGPPLDYHNWAMNPFLGKVLAQVITRYEPDHIVECGSGTSTVFMAHLLKKMNSTGVVTALEHHPAYAEKTRQLIEDHGLKETAEVLKAPLEEKDVDGKSLSWYGVSPGQFEEKSIDLLVVDGPPEATGPLARYPAVFVLRSCLSDDCVVVMDDGKREDEQQAARRWAEVLDAKIEYKEGTKGTYILRR